MIGIRDTASDKPGIAALGNNRKAILATDMYNRGHLLSAVWAQNGQAMAGDAASPILIIGRGIVRSGQNMRRADNLGKLFN